MVKLLITVALLDEKVKFDRCEISELSLYTEPVRVEELDALLKKLSAKDVFVPHPPKTVSATKVLLIC